MRKKWEYEDEYMQLNSALRQARKDDDLNAISRYESRIQEMDTIMWQEITDKLTELKPYTTFIKALESTANKLGFAFPDLTEPSIRKGNGKFSFAISDGLRTIQIWPREDLGYYSVEIYNYKLPFDHGIYYKGKATSLGQLVLVISMWFLDRCTIESLNVLCPWMPIEPYHQPVSRVSYEN